MLAVGDATDANAALQYGYSPATIAAEIAGLICAASIAQANGATSQAATYQSSAWPSTSPRVRTSTPPRSSASARSRAAAR